MVLSPNLTGLGNFPLFTPAHQLLLPMLVRANTSSIRRSRSAVAGLSTSLFIGGFSKTSICSVMTRAWGGVNHKKAKTVGRITFGAIIPSGECGVSWNGANLVTCRFQTCLFVIVSPQGAPALNSSSISAHHWAISTRSSQNWARL